jgi:hypothetical protein
MIFDMGLPMFLSIQFSKLFIVFVRRPIVFQIRAPSLPKLSPMAVHKATKLLTTMRFNSCNPYTLMHCPSDAFAIQQYFIS